VAQADSFEMDADEKEICYRIILDSELVADLFQSFMQTKVANELLFLNTTFHLQKF
jgi:hypothetical protein